MKTSSGSRRFRLPIPWDLAIAVLTHTAHIGRTPFRTQRHGNGYMRLHQSRALRASIAIDIHSFAELDGATTIMAVDVTKGIRISDRSSQHVDAMLDQFKSGGEVLAARLARLNHRVTATSIDGSSSPLAEHVTIVP